MRGLSRHNCRTRHNRHVPEMIANLIGSEWRKPSNGVATLPIYNPATGDVIGQVPLSGANDVDAAVTRFSQVVSASCLIDPANIKPQGIAGQIDPAEKFQRFFRTWFGTSIQTRPRTERQDKSNREGQEKPSGHDCFPRGFLEAWCRSSYSSSHDVAPFQCVGQSSDAIARSTASSLQPMERNRMGLIILTLRAPT